MTEEFFEEFSYVWDHWILSTIQSVYNQMDPDFKKITTIRDLDSIKQKASAFFDAKIDDLKALYYGGKSSGQRMDFHKLSAILCRTMIEYKVIQVDKEKCSSLALARDAKDTDWLVRNALVNFRVAFFSSVVFLYQSTLFKLEKEKSNINIYESLRDQKKFNLYVSSNQKKVNHESFENSIVLDLAKRDLNGRSFDYFMYSAIMYQLEEYNLLLLRNLDKFGK